MNTTNASNGWRWIGLAILLLILLILWFMSLGPSLSGAQSGCCGVPTTAQPVAPVTVTKSPVNVAFKAEAGKVVLSGEMPTEADRHAAFNAAATIFGADKVIDKLTVWKNATLPDWWQRLGIVLAWVKSGADFGISQQDQKVTITGSVDNDAAKASKSAEIGVILGSGANIDNQLFAAHLAPIAATPTPAPVAPPTSVVPPCSGDTNVAILFNTGSAELSASGKRQLDEVSKCLAAPTEVAGHTDDVGNDAFNVKLSKARANAVVAYIAKTKPGKAKLLTAAGFGETKPIADNATAEGRAKNRRIEFIAK